VAQDAHIQCVPTKLVTLFKKRGGLITAQQVEKRGACSELVNIPQLVAKK
jgi:hypothetical protein